MTAKKLNKFITDNKIEWGRQNSDVFITIPIWLIGEFCSSLGYEFFIDTCFLKCELKFDTIIINISDVLYYFDINIDEIFLN